MNKHYMGKYGKLTLWSYHGRNSKNLKQGLFECDCGNVVVKPIVDVVRGHTKSCGCLSAESNIARNTKHGMKGERIYTCWLAMRSRCEKPQNKSYKHYGGRGIKLCDEWHDAYVFKEWALQNGYSDDLQIERVNNDGDYEPSNCRWATRVEQANNKRTNKLININGETKTAAEWARNSGITYNTIITRLKRGWRGVELLRPMRRYPRGG